jgi:hypothetical protein
MRFLNFLIFIQFIINKEVLVIFELQKLLILFFFVIIV